MQYLARTVGAFGYQYANDLLFETGPGVYLLLGDNWLGAPYAFGAQVLFSGETKGTDTLDGQRVGDTAITALYLGPAFRFTWGIHLGARDRGRPARAAEQHRTCRSFRTIACAAASAGASDGDSDLTQLNATD